MDGRIDEGRERGECEVLIDVDVGFEKGRKYRQSKKGIDRWMVGRRKPI